MVFCFLRGISVNDLQDCSGLSVNLKVFCKVCGCSAGGLTGCNLKHDVLCKQETRRNLFARRVLNAQSVLNALLKHITEA